MSSAHCAVVQEVASVLFASLAALEAVLSCPVWSWWLEDYRRVDLVEWEVESVV